MFYYNALAQKKMDLEIKERDEKYTELDTKFNRLHKRAKQRIQEVQKVCSLFSFASFFFHGPLTSLLQSVCLDLITIVSFLTTNLKAKQSPSFLGCMVIILSNET